MTVDCLNYSGENLHLGEGCSFCLRLVLDARSYTGFHAFKIAAAAAAAAALPPINNQVSSLALIYQKEADKRRGKKSREDAAERQRNDVNVDDKEISSRNE